MLISPPMARPRNSEANVVVEVTLSPKLLKYLDQLKDMEGFGNSRPEIIRNFVWKEVERLLEVQRLKSID
jgi:metal-responsive CopG/Arc/MetJ family transcriptional regulator